MLRKLEPNTPVVNAEHTILAVVAEGHMLKKRGNETELRKYEETRATFNRKLISWLEQNLQDSEVSIRYIAGKSTGSARKDRLIVKVRRAEYLIRPTASGINVRDILAFLYKAYLFKKVTFESATGGEGKFNLFACISLAEIMCGGIRHAVFEALLDALDMEPEKWQVGRFINLAKLLSLYEAETGEKGIRAAVLKKAVDYLFSKEEQDEENFIVHFALVKNFFAPGDNGDRL